MTSPVDPQPQIYSHINGSPEDLLDRCAVAELCKGWSVYRDASEWANYRDLFAKEANVWTTWSGPKTIEEFIQVSKDGKANGEFIMHRECGTLVDLGRDRTRAVGKMKVTITQRFQHHGVEYDVDCDGVFVYFCLKVPQAGWKIRWYKVFYCKDKLVTVGVPTPEATAELASLFTNEELDKYPEGYKYLAVAQHSLGHEIDLTLPTWRNEYGQKMYQCMKEWLDGKEINLFW